MPLLLINHLLSQNPEIRDRLRAHAGRCARLLTPAWTCTATVGEDGYLQPTDATAETVITVRPSALASLVQGRRPGVGDMMISGDQALGMALLPLFAGLRYWPNQDLARVLGDAAAGQAMRLIDSLGRQLADSGRSLAAQISDYAHEEAAPLVHRQRFAAFAEAVDTLRDDTERLEARLRRWQNRR